MTRPLRDRFEEKYEPEPTTGCWIWNGSQDSRGYGRMKIRSYTLQLAHRVAYELFVGPISTGMELDHLCRTPACVNPLHLEPVTHRENCIRSLRARGKLRV
jgi:hypothetical protein